METILVSLFVFGLPIVAGVIIYLRSRDVYIGVIGTIAGVMVTASIMQLVTRGGWLL